jgi:hypothetical protein
MLSNFRLFGIDDLQNRLETYEFKNKYYFNCRRYKQSDDKKHIIDDCFIKLFENPNVKSLIITIFDRELFNENIEYFDKFNKLFGNLGNGTRYINITNGDNILEKIDTANKTGKFDPKPNFVFLYCCCGGGNINKDDVIQVGNSDPISVNSIVDIATGRNSDVPIFMILECGRGIYNLNYVNTLGCVKYNIMTTYHMCELGNEIFVGMTEFQKFLYDKLINMRKIDDPTDPLSKFRDVKMIGNYHMILSSHEKTSSSWFYRLFMKK